MKKTNGWLNALFALIFIAVPALILYYFFLKDWGVEKRLGNVTWTEAKVNISTGATWGIALGFLAFSSIFAYALVYFKVLSYDSLSFSLPLALVLFAIFVTYGVPMWGRALIVIALILFAFPVNAWVNNLKRKEIKKMQNNKRK